MANALKFRDYRLLWFGSLISNVGEGMREVAEDWLVIVMTESPLLLGVVSLCKGPSRLFLGPVFGVMVDRFDRKLVMIVAQIFHLAVMLAYGILVTTGLIRFWHVIILASVDGLVSPIIRITRHTVIPDLVPRESLMNALSINSVGSHTSHVLGPLIGGILIGWLGTGAVFYLIALSFCAIIVSLVIMHIPRRAGDLPRLQLGREIGEALTFLRKNSLVFDAMTMQFFSFFLVLPFTRLLPIYAKDILRIGPTGLGLLRGCFAGGNVLGGLGLVSLGEAKNQHALLLGASLTVTLSLILFAHASWLPLSLVLLGVIGVSSMVYRVIGLLAIQLNVPDQLRGRVMGLYNLEAGFRSVGGLLYGASASLLGTPITVSLGGVIFGFCTVLFRRRRERDARRKA